MQGPRCNACVPEVPAIINTMSSPTWEKGGSVRSSHVKRQLSPRNPTAQQLECQSRKVIQSQQGNWAPRKAETSPKPPSWSVAESGQEPRPPVTRPLLIPLPHMHPLSPSGQGTSFVHLCNQGEGGSWETGRAVHSANSFHGSLAPGSGPGWWSVDVNATSKGKENTPSLLRGKTSSWNGPELSSGSRVEDFPCQPVLPDPST